jgi:hypothetical protein
VTVFCLVLCCCYDLSPRLGKLGGWQIKTLGRLIELTFVDVVMVG